MSLDCNSVISKPHYSKSFSTDSPVGPFVGSDDLIVRVVNRKGNACRQARVHWLLASLVLFCSTGTGNSEWSPLFSKKLPIFSSRFANWLSMQQLFRNMTKRPWKRVKGTRKAHRPHIKQWDTNYFLIRSTFIQRWPRGLMDKASDFGSEDCGFDSRRGRFFFFPRIFLFSLSDVYHDSYAFIQAVNKLRFALTMTNSRPR